MGKYDVLYRLKLEHEYYSDKICRGIDVRVEPSTVKLLQCRGIIFKQTAVNEWCLLGDCSMGIPYAKTDKFLFNLYLTDPSFLNYTKWTDFHPNNLYFLSLPTSHSEFINALRKEEGKKKINSGFCIANLQFNCNSFNDQADTSENILSFQTNEVTWEYEFVNRNLMLGSHYKFKLTEENAKVEFSAIDEESSYLIRFKSKNPIKMAESYDYHISLRDEKTNAKLLEEIPFPVPGQFMDFNENTAGEAGVETIRQVCYF